ncbi:DUF3263 domain-containing protein, partial [Streptomyces caniscabiei]|uniref:DUF3263 domain-containing protein n=1 Tax=Streptomyces caniscabiei TaxID=2746961 RepID=UPI0038D43F07
LCGCWPACTWSRPGAHARRSGPPHRRARSSHTPPATPPPGGPGGPPVRYYQLLNALLDDPRALAHDPVTINRLRRVREARREER